MKKANKIWLVVAGMAMTANIYEKHWIWLIIVTLLVLMDIFIDDKQYV